MKYNGKEIRTLQHSINYLLFDALTESMQQRRSIRSLSFANKQAHTHTQPSIQLKDALTHSGVFSLCISSIRRRERERKRVATTIRTHRQS